MKWEEVTREHDVPNSFRLMSVVSGYRKLTHTYPSIFVAVIAPSLFSGTCRSGVS